MEKSSDIAREARLRLVEAGGLAAHDLGFGRLLGQIVVYLYLSDGERSLDQIEADLGVSKAAASGATRQLESLGLLRRCWRKGDRKVYYRTADNLGDVFRDGMVALMRRKVEAISSELENTEKNIRDADCVADHELKFLASRIKRAKDLSGRAGKLLNSRMLRLLAR